MVMNIIQRYLRELVKMIGLRQIWEDNVEIVIVFVIVNFLLLDI